MPVYNQTVLKADAANRAWRTLIQQLVIDVLFAVVIVLAPLVSDANTFSDFEWKALAFLVAKTVLSVIFSYVMRLKLDPSSFPTPLPPEYPGEPNDQPDDNNVPRIVPNNPGEYKPDRAMDDNGNPL